MSNLKDERIITQKSLGVSIELTKEEHKERWLEWCYSYQRLVDFDTKKYDEIFEENYKKQNSK